MRCIGDRNGAGLLERPNRDRLRRLRETARDRVVHPDVFVERFPGQGRSERFNPLIAAGSSQGRHALPRAHTDCRRPATPRARDRGQPACPDQPPPSERGRAAPLARVSRMKRSRLARNEPRGGHATFAPARGLQPAAHRARVRDEQGVGPALTKPRLEGALVGRLARAHRQPVARGEFPLLQQDGAGLDHSAGASRPSPTGVAGAAARRRAAWRCDSRSKNR